MAAMHIDSKQLKTLIGQKKTFLVDFFAPWCPHCRKIGPAYDALPICMKASWRSSSSTWTRMTASGRSLAWS